MNIIKRIIAKRKIKNVKKIVKAILDGSVDLNTTTDGGYSRCTWNALKGNSIAIPNEEVDVSVEILNSKSYLVYITHINTKVMMVYSYTIIAHEGTRLRLLCR